VAIVGTGRLATALADGLTLARWPVTVVAGRRRAGIRKLRRIATGASGTTSVVRAAQDARVILLAVADRAIASVARELAAGKTAVDGRVVLHHAGALGPEPLEPLRSRGASVGVLHPLQAVGSGERPGRSLRGAWARIEGDPPAVEAAIGLSRALGMHPLPLPLAMEPRDRVAYHAAASIVSNDVVGLFALAVELIRSLGPSRGEAVDALLPLASGALARVAESGVEEAMTGPVARGDSETLGAHLEELARRHPEAEQIHRALSRVLLRLRPRAPRAETDDDRLRRLLDARAGGRPRGPRV
jgi:predicted short-subunit dehydrogenase-like oxidoreductase (DUF2520 family)